jgi:predicted DNA-binding transcriptional regulator AlpA
LNPLRSFRRGNMENRNVDNEFLSYRRLGKVLEIDPLTISYLVKKGDFPPPVVRDGRPVFWVRDVERWVKDREERRI